MFCEGDKTYPENVGCPVCGMDLVKITGNDDKSEDDTYKNLKKKFWISAAFTLPIFILSMGGMFFEFPFSSRNFWNFTIDFHASSCVFHRLVFIQKSLDFF